MEGITVLIVTWNRLSEIKQTIRGLWKNVRFSGNLRFHIADDGSPEGYIESIISEFPYINFSTSVVSRGGWGKNVNTALKQIESPYVFLIEDDYVCRKPVNFDDGIGVLESQSNIVCIRYDGVAGHELNLSLRETKDGIQYMIINFDSPHLNIYSNRPHLRKHKQFIDAYGYYPEGIMLGATEEAFAHRVRDKKSGKFAILWDGVENKFDHIGVSRQGTEHDIRE